MTRWGLQTLAEERMSDAEALLAAGRWSAAYYLAGYAVECAIKACIAKLVQQYDFPDKKTVLDSYSHDLVDLCRVAQLPLKERMNEDKRFGVNWQTVKDWSEQARYATSTEEQARDMMRAIIDPEAGVVPWLRSHW